MPQHSPDPMDNRLPPPQAVLARAGSENFPVALRLLGRNEQRHLMAVYGFARLVDDIGDEVEPVSARGAALDWVEDELERAAVGRATHPLFVDLGRAIAGAGLPLQPLHDLVAANRLEQLVSQYRTYDQLLGSCELSANPVGRLVLAIFGVSRPDRVAYSDDVCTGLQIVEHLQDVGEDARRGHVYLAEEDRETFGCSVDALLAPLAGVPLRNLVADYGRRARALLGAAVPLARGLPARPKLAIAAFAAGGLAALDAIEAAGNDVLGVTCRPKPRRVAVHAARIASGVPERALSRWARSVPTTVARASHRRPAGATGQVAG